MVDLFSEEATRLAEAGWDRAREEALQHGVAVFYRDRATGLDVMHEPDGRRFEIRYIAGAPREQNFEIVREVGRVAPARVLSRD